MLEPGQDSKVPASIIEELDTLDVRFLHVHVDNIGGPFGGNSSFIALYGDEVTGPCPDEPTIPGDLNGDGVVDGADLGILLSSWGPCEHCAADLNGDGVVDGADLGVLLSAWTS